MGNDCARRVLALAAVLIFYVGGTIAETGLSMLALAGASSLETHFHFRVAPSPPSGAHQAFRAVAVERHTLPEASELAQLAGALNGSCEALAAAGAVVAARGLCAQPSHLHARVLLGDESMASAAADLGLLLERQLQPALASLGVHAVVSSSIARFPPPLPAQQLRWDAKRQAHVLPAAAAATWVQRLQQAGRAGGAAVLVYAPPQQHQPLLLEAPDHSIASSMALGDDSLLLVADQAGNSSRSAGGGATSHALSQGVAAATLTWLLQPLESLVTLSAKVSTTGPDAGAVDRLRQALAAACAANAAAAVQQFVVSAAAAPRQPVTAAASRQAVAALRLLQTAAAAGAAPQAEHAALGPSPPALAAALAGWAAAQELQQDATTGAHPAFPPEHSLAVLMPLALPLTLVLAQAVGREVGALRRRRRRQCVAEAGEAGEAAAAAAAAACPLAR